MCSDYNTISATVNSTLSRFSLNSNRDFCRSYSITASVQDSLSAKLFSLTESFDTTRRGAGAARSSARKPRAHNAEVPGSG